MPEPLREHTGPVHQVLKDMYAALGNRSIFDSHLHPSLTLWEEDRAGALLDLAGLDSLRDAREQEREQNAGVSVSLEDVLVDRWPDVAAVARYVLVGRSGDQESRYRCTDVLTCTAGEWRLVHRHSSPAPSTS